MADAFMASGSFAAARRTGDYGVFVNVPEIPLYVPALARRVLTELTVDTIRLAMQELSGAISDEAGSFANTGALAQSWGAGMELVGSPESTSGIYGRVFSALPYALPMDLGRRPGSPISRAGVDAIGKWAERKLGLSAEEADKAKWGIAVSIIQRGIEGKHYVDDGIAKAAPRVDALFVMLSDAVALELAGTSKGGGRSRDARGRFVR
jgi:hypothetical protein